MSDHTCCPSLSELFQRTRCSEVVKGPDGRWAKCGRPLVRIKHGPYHAIDGKPCGFPDYWPHCWIPEDWTTQPVELLALPRWTLA